MVFKFFFGFFRKLKNKKKKTGIKSILNETESTILFISLEHLQNFFQLLEKNVQTRNDEKDKNKTLLQIFWESFPKLKHIIYLPEKFLDTKYQAEIDES